MPRYYITEIRNALDYVLQDKKVILLGEDIKDPFGGCFKVTKGLSSKYPEQVINTPISEAAITGVASGLALAGFKPILEIMFYDFLTLSLDQIFNHMINFKKLWNIDLNITIRTVIGKKDYGISHCKDLDFLFKDILTIIHPSINDDIYSLLVSAVEENKPILFVEESNLYWEKI